LLNGGAQLNRLVDQLNSIVSTDTGPSTVSALVAATHELQTTAPDLVDALHEAVGPLQTFAETRGQLATLLTGADHTLGTTYQSFDHHMDQLIRITTDLTPVLGVLAMKSNNFVPGISKLDNLANRFMDEVWLPGSAVGNMRAILSFTPTYPYTRADCPHYGELKGPSCFTAPLVPMRPAMPPVLLPQNYQPPKDLAPPPGTAVGPDGNLVAVGPPLINPSPDLTDRNKPLPPGVTPAAPVPGSANADLPPGAPATPRPQRPWVAPVAPKAPWAVPQASFTPPGGSFGGTVGPVGSTYERNMLGVITGGNVTPATQLLLGPVARGTTVSLKHADEGPK